MATRPAPRGQRVAGFRNGFVHILANRLAQPLGLDGTAEEHAGRKDCKRYASQVERPAQIGRYRGKRGMDEASRTRRNAECARDRSDMPERKSLARDGEERDGTNDRRHADKDRMEQAGRIMPGRNLGGVLDIGTGDECGKPGMIEGARHPDHRLAAGLGRQGKSHAGVPGYFRAMAPAGPVAVCVAQVQRKAVEAGRTASAIWHSSSWRNAASRPVPVAGMKVRDSSGAVIAGAAARMSAAHAAAGAQNRVRRRGEHHCGSYANRAVLNCG